ncbi:GNAT family N-acetyltransferase [Pigmentiphaga aceris]|uniref:GNAT family N-acetyltransferase n=2 Tax=Pigmentiphaga aceris TaxID=1940612 RepID=A0A5C0B5K8_9BURK|nr:GNAT family N-acetyltransferase [Pigmentiphaga aceris]
MAPGTPGFIAPFDLLTTADPALKARIARLPGSRVWSAWLRIRTAFVGTTVSEYLLAPAKQMHAAEWVRTIMNGPASKQRLLIVKDIPDDSPLLDAAERAHAAALTSACRDAGMVMVEGQALAYVPIDFDSTDTYLARLSSSRRKNLRRKLRSREDLQISTVRTGDAQFNDSAVIDQYYARYLEVYAQSELHFDQLSRPFFEAILQDGDNGGVVFEYRHDGLLIGFNLCFEYGGNLVDKYVGFTYPQARDHNLYFVSWMVNLEYALAHGCRFYVAGWTDPEVKASLGAQFTFTRHAVLPRNRLLRVLTKRFASHFESDRAWRDAREAAGKETAGKSTVESA